METKFDYEKTSLSKRGEGDAVRSLIVREGSSSEPCKPRSYHGVMARSYCGSLETLAAKFTKQRK